MMRTLRIWRVIVYKFAKRLDSRRCILLGGVLWVIGCYMFHPSGKIGHAAIAGTTPVVQAISIVSLTLFWTGRFRYWILFNLVTLLCAVGVVLRYLPLTIGNIHDTYNNVLFNEYTFFILSYFLFVAFCESIIMQKLVKSIIIKKAIVVTCLVPLGFGIFFSNMWENLSVCGAAHFAVSKQMLFESGIVTLSLSVVFYSIEILLFLCLFRKL